MLKFNAFIVDDTIPLMGIQHNVDIDETANDKRSFALPPNSSDVFIALDDPGIFAAIGIEYPVTYKYDITYGGITIEGPCILFGQLDIATYAFSTIEGTPAAENNITLTEVV